MQCHNDSICICAIFFTQHFFHEGTVFSSYINIELLSCMIDYWYKSTRSQRKTTLCHWVRKKSRTTLSTNLNMEIYRQIAWLSSYADWHLEVNKVEAFHHSYVHELYSTEISPNIVNINNIISDQINNIQGGIACSRKKYFITPN